MNLDPVQVGQALGTVVLVAVSAGAVIRQRLGSWAKKQTEAREKDSAAQRRALKRAIQSELKAALSAEMKNLSSRLERLEHAFELFMKGTPKPTRRTASEAPRKRT